MIPRPPVAFTSEERGGPHEKEEEKRSVRWGSERSSLLPGPIEEGKREREEKVAAAKSESVSPT